MTLHGDTRSSMHIGWVGRWKTERKFVMLCVKLKLVRVSFFEILPPPLIVAKIYYNDDCRALNVVESMKQ